MVKQNDQSIIHFLTENNCSPVYGLNEGFVPNQTILQWDEGLPSQFGLVLSKSIQLNGNYYEVYTGEKRDYLALIRTDSNILCAQYIYDTDANTMLELVGDDGCGSNKLYSHFYQDPTNNVGIVSRIYYCADGNSVYVAYMKTNDALIGSQIIKDDDKNIAFFLMR
jgi:hypothetical protein